MISHLYTDLPETAFRYCVGRLEIANVLIMMHIGWIARENDMKEPRSLFYAYNQLVQVVIH